MAGRVEMLERVRVLRIFAASDMAADQTDAKLRPRGPDRETVLATLARREHGLDVAEVLAELGHGPLLGSQTARRPANTATRE